MQTNLSQAQIAALRANATFDQLQAAVGILAEAVIVADLYLNNYDTSAPSRIKAETRFAVEEAMALLRPQP